MPVLKGQRICLREYRSEDFSAISAWINDESTTRWMSTRFWPPQTAVDVQDYLSRMLQSSPNAYNFVIADLADESYIGQLDMFRVDWRLRQGEIGLLIAKAEKRGQGCGQEALRLFERFAFQNLGLERLEMEVFMENKAALACYEKVGFTLEGVKRHAYWADGRFGDVGVMSILREEYLSRCTAPVENA